MSNSVTKNDKTRRSSILKDLYAETSKSSLIKTAFKNIAEKLRAEGRAPRNLEEYLVGPVIGINIYPGSSIESIVDIDGDVTDYYVQTAFQWWNYYMPGQDSPSKAQFRDELQRIYNDYVGGHKFSYPDPVKQYKPYAAPVPPAVAPTSVKPPPAPPIATPPITTQTPPPLQITPPPIGKDDMIEEESTEEEIITIDPPTTESLGEDITTKGPSSQEIEVISGPGGDLDDGDFDSEESDSQNDLYKINEDGFTPEDAAEASSEIKAIYRDIFEMIYLNPIKEVEDKEALLLSIKSSSKYLEDNIVGYHKALPPVLAGYFEIFANNCIGSSAYIYNKLVNPGGDLKAKQKYISAIGEVLDGRDHFSASFFDMVDDLSSDTSKDNMITLQYLSELMVDFISSYLEDQRIDIDLTSASNTVTKAVVSRSFCLDITDDVLGELLPLSGSDFKVTSYNEKQITFSFGHFELGKNNSKFSVKSETISFKMTKEVVSDILKGYDEGYITDAIDEAKLKYKELFFPRTPEGEDPIEVLSTIVFNEMFYVLNAKPVELGREMPKPTEESSEEIITTEPAGTGESSEEIITTEPTSTEELSEDEMLEYKIESYNRFKDHYDNEEFRNNSEDVFMLKLRIRSFPDLTNEVKAAISLANEKPEYGGDQGFIDFLNDLLSSDDIPDPKPGTDKFKFHRFREQFMLDFMEIKDDPSIELLNMGERKVDRRTQFNGEQINGLKKIEYILENLGDKEDPEFKKYLEYLLVYFKVRASDKRLNPIRREFLNNLNGAENLPVDKVFEKFEIEEYYDFKEQYNDENFRNNKEEIDNLKRIARGNDIFADKIRSAIELANYSPEYGEDKGFIDFLNDLLGSDSTPDSKPEDSSEVVGESSEEAILSSAEVTEEELIKSLETEYDLEEAAFQALFHLFTGKDHFSAQEVELAKKLLERGGVLEGFIGKLHPGFPNNPSVWVISNINADRPGVNNTNPNNRRSHKNLDIREGDNRQKLINALSASDKVEVTIEGATVFVNVTSDEKKKRLRSWVSDQIRKAGYKSNEFSQLLVDQMIITAKEGAIDAYVKSNIKSIFDKEGNLKDSGPKIISGIPYDSLLEIVGEKSVNISMTDKNGTRRFNTKNINLVAKKDGKSFNEDFFQLFKNSAEIQGLVISETNDKNGKPVHFRYFRIGMESINEEYCREYHKEFLENIDPMDRVADKDKFGKDRETIELEASNHLKDLQKQYSITSDNKIQHALINLHMNNKKMESFSVAQIFYALVRADKKITEEPADLKKKSNFEAFCFFLNKEILKKLKYLSNGKEFRIVKHSDNTNPCNIRYTFENFEEAYESLKKSVRDTTEGAADRIEEQKDSGDFYSIIDIRFKVINLNLKGAMEALFNPRRDEYHIEKYIDVSEQQIKEAVSAIRNSDISSDRKKEAIDNINSSFSKHIFGINKKGNDYFKKYRKSDQKNSLIEKFKFDLYDLSIVSDVKEEALQSNVSSILNTMNKEEYILLVKENISNIISKIPLEEGKKAATEIAKDMYEKLGIISYSGYKNLANLISKGRIREIENLDSNTLPVFSSILSTLDSGDSEELDSTEDTSDGFSFEDRFLNDVVYAANTLFINKGKELDLNGEVYDDYSVGLIDDNSKATLVLIGNDGEYYAKKEDIFALFDAAELDIPQDIFGPAKYEEEAKSESEMLTKEEVEYIFRSLRKAPVIEYDGESYYGIKSKPFGKVDLLGLTREVLEDAKEVLDRNFFINPDVFIIKSKLDTLEGGSFDLNEINNIKEEPSSVSTEDDSKMSQDEYDKYKKRFENMLKSIKDGALDKGVVKSSLKSQNIFMIKEFLKNAKEDENPELIELLRYLSDSKADSQDDPGTSDNDSVEVSEDDSGTSDNDSVEVSEDDSGTSDNDSVEVSEDDSGTSDNDGEETSEDGDAEGEGSTAQNMNEELDNLDIETGSIQKLCFDFDVKDLFSEEAAKEIVKAKHEVMRALNDLGAKDISSAVTIQSLINKTTDGKVLSAVKSALFHPMESQLIQAMIEEMIISLVDKKGPYTNKRLYLNLKTTEDTSGDNDGDSNSESAEQTEEGSETSSEQSSEQPLSSADETGEQSSELYSSASEKIYDNILKESGVSSEIPSSLNTMENSGYLFPILDIVLMKSSDYRTILAEGTYEGQEKGPLAMFISENAEFILDEMSSNQNYLKDISKDLVSLALMISNHNLNKDESGQPIFATMSKGKGKPRIGNIEHIMSVLLLKEKKKDEITDFITDDGRDNTPDDYDEDNYSEEDLNDSDDSLVNEKDFEEKFKPLSDSDKELVSDFIYRMALSKEIFLPKEELVGQMDLSYYMIDQDAEYEKESDKDQELSKISDVLRKMYKMDGFGSFEGDLSEKICDLRSTHKALQSEEDSETVCDKISSIISGMLVDELDLGSSSDSKKESIISSITKRKTSDDYNQIELERLLNLEFEKFKDKDGKERAGFFKEAHPGFVYQSMIKSFIPDEYHVINKLELFDKKQTLADRYYNILINLMNGIYPNFFKEVIQFIKATDALTKEIAESDEIRNIKSKMKSLNKDSEEYEALKSNLYEVVFAIKSKQDICNESIIEIFEDKIGFSKLNDALQSLDQFPKSSIIVRKGSGKNPVLGSFDEDLEYIKTAMSRPLRDGLNSHIFTAIGNYFFPEEPLRISYTRSLSKGMIESEEKESYKKNLKVAFEYLKNRDKIDYSDEKHRVKIDGIIESLSKYLNLRFGAVFSIEAESIYSRDEQEDLEDQELNASSYQNAAIMVQNKEGEREAEAKEEISSKPVDFIGIHNSLLKILYYRNISDDSVLSNEVARFVIYYIYNDHKYKFKIKLPPFYYDENLSNGKGGVTSRPLDIAEDISNLQVILERQDVFEQGNPDSISYLRKIYSNGKSDKASSSFNEKKLNVIKALLSIGAKTMGGSTKGVIDSYEQSSLNISGHSITLYGKSEEFIYKTLKLEKSYDGYFVNMIGVRNPVAIIDETSLKVIELYNQEKDKEKYILDIELESDINTVEVISHKEFADIKDIKQLAGYEARKRAAIYSLTNEEYDFFFRTNYIYNIVGDGDEKKGANLLSKNSKAISNNDPDYVDFDILAKHLEAIESIKTLDFLSLDDIERKCFAKIVSKKKDHKYLFLKSMISEDSLNSQFVADFKPKEQRDGSIKNTREKGMDYFGIKILGEFYQSKFIKDSTGDYADIILFDSEVDAISQYMEYQKGGAKQFENIIANDEIYKINEEADLDSKMNAALSYAMNMMNIAISYGKERSDISNKITSDFGRILKYLVCGYIMRNPNKKPPMIEWDLNIINNSFDSEDLNETLKSAYGNKSKTIQSGGLEISFASAYIKSNIKEYIAEAIIENSSEKLMNIVVSLSTLVIADYRIKSRKVKQKDKNTFKKMIYPENPTVSIPLFVSSEVVVEEGVDLDEESIKMSEKEIKSAMEELVETDGRLKSRYLRRSSRLKNLESKLNLFERSINETFLQRFFDAFTRLSDYFKYTNSADRLGEVYKMSDAFNKTYMELYGEEELTNIIGEKEVERLK